MESLIINALGLICDIAGAILLFMYGLPSDMYNRKLSKYELAEQKARHKALGASDYRNNMDKKDLRHENNTKTGSGFELTL